MGQGQHLGEFFDPQAEFFISERMRPHWSQAGAVVFLTFRTRDSIPKSVIKRWDREKNDWLDQQSKLVGTDLRRGRFWREVQSELPSEVNHRFQKHFNRHREDLLDNCFGKCLLKQPRFANIVSDSLLHFDGIRYRMGDFVIMPNHVHLLAAFPSPELLESQARSWMHFTAREINRLTGERAKFWQPEAFDHLVRSPEQYEYLRTYICDNPAKAKLLPGQYLYRRYDG